MYSAARRLSAAQVLLDLLEKSDSERTRLTLVRSKPVPFPPEPLRSAVVQRTRSSLARADRNESLTAGLTAAGAGYQERPRPI
jgi:hypothetical protein